ncbi:MAG TPA: hypothetical protein VE546_02770 [Streptomyces sp.]|uniref:hypothetical protein n=1 Tax=Streptomyces sp. TaxID=1931 RepID=UPI002D2D40D2|nr:hypothetical protein [Streptomyces sp.]HZG02496.1 hypothetical protein [Streptomyces sp.]
MQRVKVRSASPDAMSVARQVPLRASTGLFLINSGLGKANADEETAGGLHGFASGAYPFVRRLEPRRFVGVLSKTEIGLGTALLLPGVPAVVAGAGLTAFSLGTLGMYLRVPGMRQGNSLRWTEQGLPLAKDVWMLGIGVSLVIDGLTRGLAPRRGRGRGFRRR